MAIAGGCSVQSSAFEPSSYFGEKRARRQCLVGIDLGYTAENH